MTETFEFHPVSLMDRIKIAGSNQELVVLINEGNGYQFARDKTRRRWTRAAASRKMQLKKVVTESEPKPKTISESDKKGSKK